MYRLSCSHNFCVGLYLTDVTFCREGNPNFRASPTNSSKKLLNFNKYHKLARIVQGWCLGIVKGLLSECVAQTCRGFKCRIISKSFPKSRHI